MATFGYARVSTAEQNEDRQVDALLDAGVERRCLFVEKESGAKRDRPELERMLEMLRESVFYRARRAR